MILGRVGGFLLERGEERRWMDEVGCRLSVDQLLISSSALLSLRCLLVYVIFAQSDPCVYIYVASVIGFDKEHESQQNKVRTSRIHSQRGSWTDVLV